MTLTKEISVRSKLVLTVLVLSLAWSYAGAKTPAPAGDAKTQLAVELIQVTHFDRNMQAMQQQVRTMLEKQFESEATCAAAQPTMHEFSSAVADKLSGTLSKEDLKIDVAAVYAEVFSEEELREIIAFYQSPLGEKLLDRMPELMQKSMQITQDRIRPMMPEFEKLGEQYGPRIREAAKQCESAAPDMPSGSK